jgi:hypothetical protein
VVLSVHQLFLILKHRTGSEGLSLPVSQNLALMVSEVMFNSVVVMIHLSAITHTYFAMVIRF